MSLRHDSEGELISRALLGTPDEFQDYKWNMKVRKIKTKNEKMALKQKKET
jgi:hypothetical protein